MHLSGGCLRGVARQLLCCAGSDRSTPMRHAEYTKVLLEHSLRARFTPYFDALTVPQAC